MTHKSNTHPITKEYKTYIKYII